MNPYGLLIMVLGAGLLLSMRDHASVQEDIEPKLFRLNVPRLARRFPTLPDASGRAAAKVTLVIGTIVGVAAIVRGAIIAF